MARQEGEVVERGWKRGRGYALRFRAYGERRYVSLGFERDGWDRRRAEEELQNILADVRRGLWVPPRRGSARDRDSGWEEREVPTLGRFAADLVDSNEGQVSEANTRQRCWALAHVAPLLGDLRLDEIDVRCIDEFRDLKIKESEASPVKSRTSRPSWSRVRGAGPSYPCLLVRGIGENGLAPSNCSATQLSPPQVDDLT
jgi:hypothetical protein